MKCDILNLEWTSSGRDVDIVEPILCYLEIKYKLNIIRENIFNMEHKILKYRPKLLLISNFCGGEYNFKTIQFASKLGIKVVTLTSEGDYHENEKMVNNFFWGVEINNQRFIQDIHLVWSKRVKNLISKYVKNSHKYNIQVSGAVGFDKYKFLKFMSKKKLLRKYNKSDFKKTVGIGAICFDRFHGKYYKDHKTKFLNLYSEEQIRLLRESRYKLMEIYKKLIENNPDVLFLLKHHPATIDDRFTEFWGLDKYKNTFIIKGRQEHISNIINASDFWISFESTTVLEAWILNKQTFLINPVLKNFTRSIILKGTPIYSTYEEAQQSLDSFYNNKGILGFKELVNNRKQIIKDVIGWDDGKNHIRAAEYVYKILNNKKEKKHKNGFRVKCIINYIYSNIINLFKLKDKSNNIYNNRYRQEERNLNYRRYKKELKNFYKKNDMSA